MKFFVAYVVDFQPCFWHDVNSQMVSHAKVAGGECEPMTFGTFQQAMKVMCSIRDRKRFFIQGCYAVLDDHSLPDRYGVLRSPMANPTKTRVEVQNAASKRPSRLLTNARNLENVYCIRYITRNGFRWFDSTGNWADKDMIESGDRGLRGFKTKTAAQEKLQALRKVQPSIKISAVVARIDEEFCETKEVVK